MTKPESYREVYKERGSSLQPEALADRVVPIRCLSRFFAPLTPIISVLHTLDSCFHRDFMRHAAARGFGEVAVFTERAWLGRVFILMSREHGRMGFTLENWTDDTRRDCTYQLQLQLLQL